MPYLNRFEEISQGRLPIRNPVTEEMIHTIAETAGIRYGQTIFDIGCGNGHLICTLAQRYGITGYAIDSDPDSCLRTTECIRNTRIKETIQVICADAKVWQPPDGIIPDSIIAAGVSHIWGDVFSTLEALVSLASPDTSLIIGDRYWRHDIVPHEFAAQWICVQSEYAICQYARELGYLLTGIVRATEQDWDRYEGAIWQECYHWIRNHPDDSHTDEMLEYLYSIQDEYTAYGREHMGWALFLFQPMPMV